MPELPDVEVYRRQVARGALHKRIRGVSLRQGKLRSTRESDLRAGLAGRSLEGTRRHGKYLFGELDRGGALLLHFGMSGWIVHRRVEDDAAPYEKLRLELAGGEVLAYHCRRNLGRIELVDDVDAYIARRELGPDALELDLPAFRERVGARARGLKAALTDQHVLAGLGNVYVDEILFQCGLDPRASTGAFDAAAWRRLHGAMRRVCREAIARKADPERMPETWLLPHRAQGERCPRCARKGRQVELASATVAGRTTWWCPRHQERP